LGRVPCPIGTPATGAGCAAGPPREGGCVAASLKKSREADKLLTLPATLPHIQSYLTSNGLVITRNTLLINDPSC
jgi:hypothetical protein